MVKTDISIFQKTKEFLIGFWSFLMIFFYTIFGMD
jgi:hypothetical protein